MRSSIVTRRGVKPRPTSRPALYGPAQRRLKTMQTAGLGRLGAGEERLVENPRAGRDRDFAGVAIDVDIDDPVRRFERRARTAGERAHHEGRPDGKRRLRAAQSE